jgi:hypothetical protein
MADLTDIEEILEYLATIGFSYYHYHYEYDEYVNLTSEYYTTVHSKDTMIRNYKGLYTATKYLKLLDNLLINCQIGNKYKENNYSIEIDYFIHDNTFNVHKDGHFLTCKDINNLMPYMQENHPKCIRQNDIKIALK